MAKLETINYDCHRCIGKLLVAKSNPREKEATLDSMKKGFLLNRNLDNSKQRFFDAESEPSQSNSSYESNDELIDGFEFLEHEKNILNSMLNSHSSKIEIDWDSEMSSCDSKCNADEN